MMSENVAEADLDRRENLETLLKVVGFRPCPAATLLVEFGAGVATFALAALVVPGVHTDNWHAFLLSAVLFALLSIPANMLLQLAWWIVWAYEALWRCGGDFEDWGGTFPPNWHRSSAAQRGTHVVVGASQALLFMALLELVRVWVGGFEITSLAALAGAAAVITFTRELVIVRVASPHPGVWLPMSGRGDLASRDPLTFSACVAFLLVPIYAMNRTDALDGIVSTLVSIFAIAIGLYLLLIAPNVRDGLWPNPTEALLARAYEKGSARLRIAEAAVLALAGAAAVSFGVFKTFGSVVAAAIVGGLLCAFDCALIWAGGDIADLEARRREALSRSDRSRGRKIARRRAVLRRP